MMRSGVKTRIISGLLASATVVLVAAAVVNFHQRHSFTLPTDGVQWDNTKNGLKAIEVASGGPADKSGIKPGDKLVSIGEQAMRKITDVTRTLQQVGIWSQVSYELIRGETTFKTKLIVEPVGLQLPLIYYFQWLVASLYLTIGIFVFARRKSRPMVHHFYAFCLGSFVLYSFSYTGELSGLDRFIYWGDVWATILAPAIFLHFCLVFPRKKSVSKVRAGLARWSYTPAVMLLTLHHLVAAGVIDTGRPVVEIRDLLDRLGYALLGLYLISGIAALKFGTNTKENVILQQQRKWLIRGTVTGATPFVVFYVVPYVAGYVIGTNQSMFVFSLGLIPLTFAYAIVRFRLMDVDLITRRGIAYSLAVLVVLVSSYGLGLLSNRWFTLHPVHALPPAVFWAISAIAAALIFQPLRRYIQTKLEKRFYRERYDYRKTLIDFASELRTETDLNFSMQALGKRLVKTLGLKRLAILGAFTPSEHRGKLQLLCGVGLVDARGEKIKSGAILDLDFLTDTTDSASGTKPYYFLEDPCNTNKSDRIDQQAVSNLNLNYYVPCNVRGRTVAYLGLGQTTSGDYLSSEDLTLILTVSGYLAVTLENARLINSLENQLIENERLKNYNENIVESLSVGVLAVDLSDRVESWNTQLELTFGIPRERAIGEHLSALLPPDLAKELCRIHEDSETRNIYKFVINAEEFPAPFRPSETPDIIGHGSPDQMIINAAVTPLVTRDFKPIGRLVIFDDVTEQTSLEEHLVQAEKLSSVGLLAAGIAHEVNTPLAVISSYAQMLAKRVYDNPDQAEILDKITAQTFRASEIVTSLLNVSRTSPREFTTVDLNQTVTETLTLVRPQLHKAHIEVKCHLDPEAASITGNSSQIQQVLLNLFLNARDAMPHGGQLTVSNTILEDASKDFAIITVVDTGTGIDPTCIKRVFDPFFTTKNRQKGTGLGLAVSHGIIHEHSGTMTVKSKLGQGTSFSVELPLKQKSIHV